MTLAVEGLACTIELEDGTRIPALLEMEENFAETTRGPIEDYADVVARATVSPSLIRRQWNQAGQRLDNRA